MKDTRAAFVRRKTRLRFLFAGITVLFYFAFVLLWTPAGASLNTPIGNSMITGGMAIFVALVLLFVVLELTFLWIYSRERP